MLTKIKKMIITLMNINEHPIAIQLKDSLSVPIGNVLDRLKVHPTLLNFIGLITGIISAFLIGSGNLSLGALIFLISGLADALDGTVARITDMENSFGAFFDSVCDRYVDTAVFLGVSWYFSANNMEFYTFACFVGIVGTVVTSYTRARAESLLLESRYVGFMNRPERVGLLMVGLIFHQVLPSIIWILALFTNITGIHRILYYSTQFRIKQKEL